MPPMRVWMCDGERDVRMPLELELGFEFESTAAGKGRGRSVGVVAKINNLADADAFLEFALARGRAPKWARVEARRSRLDGGNGTWVVEIVLVGEGGEEAVAVKVTASARPKARNSLGSGEKERQDRTPDFAELCGKMGGRSRSHSNFGGHDRLPVCHRQATRWHGRRLCGRRGRVYGRIGPDQGRAGQGALRRLPPGSSSNQAARPRAQVPRYRRLKSSSTRALLSSTRWRRERRRRRAGSGSGLGAGTTT